MTTVSGVKESTALATTRVISNAFSSPEVSLNEKVTPPIPIVAVKSIAAPSKYTPAVHAYTSFCPMLASRSANAQTTLRDEGVARARSEQNVGRPHVCIDSIVP